LGKVYLRKCKTRGGEGVSVKNRPMNTKVREEGEGGDASGTGAEIPLWPVEKPVLEQVYPKGTAVHEKDPR